MRDLDRDEYLVGTPEQVATRLSALHAEVPFDHFAFWARLPGLSYAEAAEAQRRFATEVGPVLVGEA